MLGDKPWIREKETQILVYLFQPRFWLTIVGAIGLIGLVYVLGAASLKPNTGSDDTKPALSALNHDRALLTGEMSDFTYALVSQKAPPVQFYRDGEALTLKKFKGKVVLVNFWASWCTPCLKELPSLNALQTKFDKDQFQIVAIASDPRGPEAAGEVLDRLNVDNLDLYADPQLAVITAFGGSNVLPLSVLFDRKGNEIGRLLGEADWVSPEAEQLVRSAL